jgi:hypothetical protein
MSQQEFAKAVAEIALSVSHAAREAGGMRYGRAIKPGEGAGRFSVDVVRMRDVKGPHHVHTTGEIGAIFPLEGGNPHIFYLLPEGAIEFTGR